MALAFVDSEALRGDAHNRNQKCFLIAEQTKALGLVEMNPPPAPRWAQQEELPNMCACTCVYGGPALWLSPQESFISAVGGCSFEYICHAKVPLSNGGGGEAKEQR